MGWDAYSVPNQYEKKNKIFERAKHKVLSRADSVDWLVEHGGLDISNCRMELERATGELCYSEDGWTKEKAKKVYENANWRPEEDVTEAEAPYYYSAKYWLEGIVEAGLGVRFSF